RWLSARSRCGVSGRTRRRSAPGASRWCRCSSRSSALPSSSIRSRPIRARARPASRWSPPACRSISSGASCMPVIDFHNHYYPPRYMKALQSGESSVKVTIDSDGNPNLHYPGDYNVAVRGHRDLAYRDEVLAAHGVDMQVVTLTTPGTHVETPATAARLASLVNDEFREAMETRGAHFTALATLPLNDPAASAKEFERAITELGLPGAMLFSNVNGVALG